MPAEAPVIPDPAAQSKFCSLTGPTDDNLFRPLLRAASSGNVHTSRMPQNAGDGSSKNQPADSQQARKEFTVAGRDDKYHIWQLAGGTLAILAFLGLLVVLPAAFHVSAGARESFGALAQRSWAVIGFSAAVGLASAAILQVGKQIFGIRSYWQRRQVASWVKDRCGVEELWRSWLIAHADLPFSDEVKPWSTPQERAKWHASDEYVRTFAANQAAAAWEQLETALLGAYARRDLRVVFDLPTEQLSALLSAAADHALTNPRENAEALLAFSGPAGLSDIDLVAPPRGIRDLRIDRSISEDHGSADAPKTQGDLKIQSGDRSKGGDSRGDAALIANEALGRLARSVRSGLDVLQASLGQEWSRAVRTWAVSLSGLLGVVLVLFINISLLQRVLFAFTALLLGGFFAWLARDLTAVVERVRR
jgi:hypothetical protein